MYLEGSLESRKFTDKDGAEREITEVVLARFRGELTLLGGRNQGGGEGGDFGDGERGGGERSGYGGGSGGRPSGGGGAARPQRAGWDAPKGDLDDDIPF